MVSYQSDQLKITNYAQAESFIMEALPMFQKVGRKALGTYELTRIHEFLDYLDNPHRSFKSIHIAGTNGKGSVSHMLAAIYHQNGFKTGLFTSPHLKTYRERIKLNGIKIPEDYILIWVQNHHQYLLKYSLSFFEMSMGLACSYFAAQRVDIAIMETGLGGRLDATNVLIPILSIVTNIDYDHQDILGDSLELIAREKAGIIKKNVPVLLGNVDPSLYGVFEEKAKEANAELFYTDNSVISHMRIDDDGICFYLSTTIFPATEIKLPSLAPYHEFNLNTIIHALSLIEDHKKLELQKDLTIKGLENFIELSQFRGRHEIIHQKPLIIADAAHNPAGIRFFNPLFKNKNVHLHVVLGFVRGKNMHDIFSLLPAQATYYFCAAKVPRAMDVQTLQKEAKQYGLKGKTWSSPKQAVEEIILNANKDDVGLILGSIYLIAEIL